ncbi:MAG TPA: hypothetical protein VG845_11560 [Dehalococcoidia bacterium]|jgi:hypothetical protein|nr:hypothetical protein [Dehalococcoidia bacterium]
MLRTILAGALTALVLSSPAWATTAPNAEVTVDCVRGKAVATFTYSGFSPHNHLTAKQRLTVWGSMYATVFEFDGPGAVSGLRLDLPNRTVPVTASTVVTAGGGRVKAEDTATVLCEVPPDPPPDPPRVRPRAELLGPCGDPLYRAKLNNRRSEKAVTFRIRFHQFGVGPTVLKRRVPAGAKVLTGHFHVTGLTWMSITAGGRTLDRERSAPGGNYPFPCK